MMFKKRKKIDETLSCFFQKEAAGVAPPSSQELWGDIKGRLEKKEILPLLPGKPKGGFASYSWIKNKPLVAMVAASSLLIIFFARVPPAPSLQQFVLNLFSPDPQESLLQDYDTVGEGDASGLGAPPPGALKAIEDLEPQQRIMVAKDSAPPFGMGEAMQGDKVGAETETGGSNQEIKRSYNNEHFTARTAKKELTWDKQTVFSSALNNVKGLAPEEVWIINRPPEGFSFLEGSVIKTENFLFQVTHQFVNEKGNILTLRQEFFPDKEVMEPFPLTDGGVADPKQVGPFSGFLFRQEDGNNILTWKQENSIVTLSGQIEEKLLLAIPNTFKKD